MSIALDPFPYKGEWRRHLPRAMEQAYAGMMHRQCASTVDEKREGGSSAAEFTIDTSRKT